MIYVPLYDTLGEAAIIHIINQSMLLFYEKIFLENILILASLKTIFIDKVENVLGLLKLAKQVSTLKRIILTKKFADDKDLEVRNKAKEVGIDILTFNQLRVGVTKEFRFNLYFSFLRNLADRNQFHIM
jgi:hypothetical protein